MSDGWCPFAARRPLTRPNFDGGRRGQGIKAVVLHIAQGPLTALYPTFNAPGGASAHFCVGKDGTLEQYVSINDTAWANGLHFQNNEWLNPQGKKVAPAWPDLIAPINPNLSTVSIEHEGFFDEAWTPAMSDANTKLLQWIANECNLSYVAHRTLIGHGDLDPADRPNCPGPTVDFDDIAAAGNGGVQTEAGQAAQNAAKLKDWLPINPNTALYSFARTQGLGFPQTDEFPFDAGVQRYIGQVFEGGVVYAPLGKWNEIQWVAKP